VSLVELLVASTVGLILVGTLFTAMASIYNSLQFSATMPTVQANARQIVETVADNLRDATVCQSTDASASPCAWVGGPLENPSASQVTTYYRPDAGATNGIEQNETYYVSGNSFKIDTTTGAVGHTTTTTQTVYSGGTITLSLVYFQADAGSTGATALTPFTPTATNSNTIVGAEITVTIVSAGNDQVTGSYSTMVKCRNCPVPSVALD